MADALLEHCLALCRRVRQENADEALLAELEDRLHALCQNTPAGFPLQIDVLQQLRDPIICMDLAGYIVGWNRAAELLFGYSADEALGQHVLFLYADEDEDEPAGMPELFLDDGNAFFEVRRRRKSGEVFEAGLSMSTIRDATGEPVGLVAHLSEIRRQPVDEEALRRQANFDGLTGLPNRVLLSQLLTQAMTEARRRDGYGALLVLDLHRFTSINDTLGHDVGDELLRQVAARLRGALRAEDVLARIGGDEFVAALIDIQKREHSALVAEKLLSALNQPFVIGEHVLHVSASIGIAVYPEDGAEAGKLLQSADVAMKRVQKGGETGYLLYSPEMNQRAKEQLRLENELRAASTAGELRLHYQPKVSLRSGRIVGAEALIRWQHPQRGLVPPGQFIPVAEETGLILDIGAWAMDETCRQIRAWQDAGLAVIPIAVNLSARQFDAQLPARMQAVLERHQVDPALIRLEITESLLVRGAENVIPIMNKLVAMGMSLALDDFGTGYSSLSYLKKFPITTLKIDRSFVVGIPDDENDCAIARAIVTMGQQLRQEIVAEGVETTEQMAFLRELGCDQLQGYLFSPPVAADEFSGMLRVDRRLELGNGSSASVRSV